METLSLTVRFQHKPVKSSWRKCNIPDFKRTNCPTTHKRAVLLQKLISMRCKQEIHTSAVATTIFIKVSPSALGLMGGGEAEVKGD